MKDDVNLPPLEEARKAVNDAEYAYQEASKAEDIARSEKVTALNHLNKAQKVFAAVVDNMKSNAGRDSDWFREKHPPRYEKVPS